MGFYIRKSFRVGPVRLNLSKSGLGLSAGVRGARIGTGPRGAYVHGGRYGLYYRKRLGGANGQGARASAEPGPGPDWRPSPEGCVAAGLGGLAALVCIALIAGGAPRTGILAGGAIAAIPMWMSVRRRIVTRRLQQYRRLLNASFVTTDDPPSPGVVDLIRDERTRIPVNGSLLAIERDVYQALIDRALDDDHITPTEAKLITVADTALSLDATEKQRLKKEVFSAAYLEVLADQDVSEAELARLNNLARGLQIPEDALRTEIKTINAFVEAQRIILPLEPLARADVPVNLQKTETAYYVTPAEVLSRRRSRTSPDGYEFTLRRKGTLVVTDRRVFVSGKGSTTVRYTNLADVEMDVDNWLLLISKTTSIRPVYVRTGEPVRAARIISLLSDQR